MTAHAVSGAVVLQSHARCERGLTPSASARTGPEIPRTSRMVRNLAGDRGSLLIRGMESPLFYFSSACSYKLSCTVHSLFNFFNSYRKSSYFISFCFQISPSYPLYIISCIYTKCVHVQLPRDLVDTQQINALCLRNGRQYTGTKWTLSHLRWLS